MVARLVDAVTGLFILEFIVAQLIPQAFSLAATSPLGMPHAQLQPAWQFESFAPSPALNLHGEFGKPGASAAVRLPSLRSSSACRKQAKPTQI